MKPNICNAIVVVKALVLVVLLALTADSATFARLLGDAGKLDPVLAELVAPMQARGIDVVAGDTSVVRLSKRPRIARLSGMPTNQPADITHVPWMDEFLRGKTGFVAGVKSADRGHAATTKDKFLAEWQKATVDRRVFLSFTSADVKAAHKAAQALRERGYVTFVFLNPGETTPRYDAVFVGSMFSQAGHHIVLDTGNARKSHGVLFEARLARGGTDGPGTGNSRPTKPKGPPGDRKGAFDEEAFVRGVSNGWVVTENPAIPDKLFVHRAISGGMLVDLLYNIKVESDGSWTVYKPGQTYGSRSFGSRLGSVRRPTGVSIGSCNCQ
jgi:hypothetical protein